MKRECASVKRILRVRQTITWCLTISMPCANPRFRSKNHRTKKDSKPWKMRKPRKKKRFVLYAPRERFETNGTDVDIEMWNRLRNVQLDIVTSIVGAKARVVHLNTHVRFAPKGGYTK
jgi:hypothetical protein